MTKQETETILAALNQIANPNESIVHAKAICEKQLAYYATLRGQIKELWDAEYFYFGGR